MRFFWSFLFLFIFCFSGAAQASYDVFVDQGNTTGVEDGTEASPFNTLAEGLAKATDRKSVV